MTAAGAFHHCQASLRAGRLAEAETIGRDLLRTAPDDARLWHLLGVIVARQDRADEAWQLFDRAIALAPENAEALVNGGTALRELRRPIEAVAAYDAAIKLRPEYAEAWNHRGTALRELDELADAVRSYDTALSLRPDYADAQLNRSVALRMMGDNAAAIKAARLALELEPGNEAAWTSLGNSLRALGRVPEALASFASAIVHSREPASAQFNHALCLLLLGEFSAGWPEYEFRWHTASMADAARDPGGRLWLGQGDIAGRTILLYAEQGLGDTIQFCRYAPLVAAQGATVLLGVPPTLRSLLRSLGDAVHLVEHARHLPRLDLHCPLMSLPLAFGTDAGSIPGRVPYLTPPEQRRRLWRERLGPRRGPRIGLAWSGGSDHNEDRDRSVPLETMAPIIASGAEIYCLQRDLRPADVPAMALFRDVRFFGHELRDFADTAALIAELDLVISVDTAVLHLTGAMGCPVWGLLPFAPDWRWMLERGDSPWYPTLRLFRQPAPRDWHSVIDRVRAELAGAGRTWASGQ
jgi:tetratricopeptide (TPR) repeat protein